jgi:hypothetical protein
MPAVAVSSRRPFLDPEFIRHLVLVQAAAGAHRPVAAAACGHWVIDS